MNRGFDLFWFLSEPSENEVKDLSAESSSHKPVESPRHLLSRRHARSIICKCCVTHRKCDYQGDS